MAATTTISLTGDLRKLVDQIVRRNFASQGIGDGTSSYKIQATILEATTDAPGPDDVYVRIAVSLALIDSRDDTPIFHEVLKAYETAPVTQISSAAWDDAFVAAMNQINDQMQAIARRTSQALRSGKQSMPDPVQEVSGSGVVVHPDGLLLTACHVVDKSETITVELANGHKLPAKLVRSDPLNDVALISVAEKTPAYLSLAPPRDGQIGQHVFTIGFPATSVLGSEPKFTEGSISGLTGPAGIATFLQISVPVQPGNSGGPLVDESGQLIGIITSTAALENFLRETGALPQNVNWAVKIDYARPLFDAPPQLPLAGSRKEAIQRCYSCIAHIIASKGKTPK